APPPPAAPMSGTLTPTPTYCTIPEGQSSCPITLSWQVNNPVNVGGTAVTSSTDNSGVSSLNFIIAPPVSSGTADVGTKTNVIIPFGDRWFYLYNNEVPLATSNVIAVCEGGTGWSESGTCQVNPPPPPPPAEPPDGKIPIFEEN
ncbi:MAG: hypothetical protein WD963_01195, partial [Candidatus Paceibacterota bacterium]